MVFLETVKVLQIHAFILLHFCHLRTVARTHWNFMLSTILSSSFKLNLMVFFWHNYIALCLCTNKFANLIFLVCD